MFRQFGARLDTMSHAGAVVGQPRGNQVAPRQATAARRSSEFRSEPTPRFPAPHRPGRRRANPTGSSLALRVPSGPAPSADTLYSTPPRLTSGIHLARPNFRTTSSITATPTRFQRQFYLGELYYKQKRIGELSRIRQSALPATKEFSSSVPRASGRVGPHRTRPENRGIRELRESSALSRSDEDRLAAPNSRN